MRPRRARSVPPRTTASAGFTLVEIVLALAIVATVFVALIGLLPAGMAASRQATDATRLGTVLEDVQNRLRGEKLMPGPASFNPALYDGEGTYLPSLGGPAKPYYRVEVAIGSWNSPPEKTSGLRPITLSVYWPVNAHGQAAPTAAPQIRLTFPAAPLTGPNWTTIDPSYVPKIEF